MDAIWALPVPVWDKVLRAVVGYAFLLIAFRVLGRRQLGQLTNFDLVVVLVVANVLQNAMIGNDNSLTGGLIGATTVLVLNAGVAATVFASRRVERIVDGDPLVLIRDGVVMPTPLRRELITRNELEAAVRRSGLRDITDVDLAMLEGTGDITILKRTGPDDP